MRGMNRLEYSILSFATANLEGQVRKSVRARFSKSLPTELPVQPLSRPGLCGLHS